MPLVSGTKKNTKMNANNASPAKIPNVYTLPASLSMLVRNTEATIKLLNQLVAVASEYAVPIRCMGYISELTAHTTPENPMPNARRYNSKAIIKNILATPLA